MYRPDPLKDDPLKERIPEWGRIERITSFDGILNVATYLGSVYGPKRLAVAAAEDGPTLKAVDEIGVQGIADSVLVGDRDKVIEILRRLKIPAKRFEIVNQPDDSLAAGEAVKLVRDGRADLLMKGLVPTSTVMKAVLNKATGIRGDGLISHVTVFEVPGFDRLMFMSDAGINIDPDLDEKREILKNAIGIARALGIDEPKVALLAAVETVSGKMASAIDDASLAKMSERGQIEGAVVDGPLALDDAVAPDVAEAKGIKSPVVGQADIFIVDDIEVGNVFYKMLVHFSRSRVAGVIAGASAPIVLTSRADSHEVKFYSIALGAIVAHQMKRVR